MNTKIQAARGFTLIEILVVIGIIAILAAVVLIAINPARQFSQANDSQRVSNVNAILNAIGQRIADNKGVFAGGACPTLPSTAKEIVIQPSSYTAGAGEINFDTCLYPIYLSAVPFDPSTGTASSTKYSVMQDANGRITVSATGQITSTIKVTR